MVRRYEIEEEARRARRVRIIVDLTSSLIMQGRLSRAEGEALVAAARARILDLFPGREETYELIYARRFGRLLREFTAQEDARSREPGRPGVILPF